MQDVIEELYAPLLLKSGFVPQPDDRRFGPMGTCWRQASDSGEGYYWTYGQKNLFDIKIHDFYFYEDSFLTFQLPECLSITYYESISGEELSPYRRLNAGCIKSFIGGQEPYQILIHKNIPITSIGIEITPAWYEDYLKKQYPGEYVNPMEAFQFVDQTDHFPEMQRLLIQVRDYRGEGIAAKLFYESKVAEAVSLIVERHKAHVLNSDAAKAPLSDADRRHLEDVRAYINDHYSFELPQERLAKIACMGSTKLKSSFKQMYHCTITEYIQNRRMSQAEHLLSSTDLTIGQVAQAVGYHKASRFSELFRKNTGFLPAEYRKLLKK